MTQITVDKLHRTIAVQNTDNASFLSRISAEKVYRTVAVRAYPSQALVDKVHRTTVFRLMPTTRRRRVIVNFDTY